MIQYNNTLKEYKTHQMLIPPLPKHTNPHITKQDKTTAVQDTYQMK
jgi:hypothetical protein